MAAQSARIAYGDLHYRCGQCGYRDPGVRTPAYFRDYLEVGAGQFPEIVDIRLLIGQLATIYFRYTHYLAQRERRAPEIYWDEPKQVGNHMVQHRRRNVFR